MANMFGSSKLTCQCKFPSAVCTGPGYSASAKSNRPETQSVVAEAFHSRAMTLPGVLTNLRTKMAVCTVPNQPFWDPHCLTDMCGLVLPLSLDLPVLHSTKASLNYILLGQKPAAVLLCSRSNLSRHSYLSQPSQISYGVQLSCSKPCWTAATIPPIALHLQKGTIKQIRQAGET